MRANPLTKIEDLLPHLNNVLLLTDGKDKPQNEDIKTLRSEVDKLVVRRSIGRSTRQNFEKNEFCKVLTFKDGLFLPHPQFISV